jgi:hypothetical protein
MSVPEHLWRFPTREAIDSLASRFDLRNTPEMQDWEWEVADSTRIDEFLAAYLSGELTSDERFTLMETLLQSFEESTLDLAADTRWRQVLAQLEMHLDLHAYSIWYWSDLDSTDLRDSFRLTPFIREILGRHRMRLESKPGAA